MRRVVLLLVTAVLLCQPASSVLRAQSQPLTFFKNYFVTGDYVVGGGDCAGGAWRVSSPATSRRQRAET